MSKANSIVKKIIDWKIILGIQVIASLALIGIIFKLLRVIADTNAIITPEIFEAHLYFCSRTILKVANPTTMAHKAQ